MGEKMGQGAEAGERDSRLTSKKLSAAVIDAFVHGYGKVKGRWGAEDGGAGAAAAARGASWGVSTLIYHDLV